MRAACTWRVPSSLPRAALDRSAPAGWVLSVDPDGTWVFTSEHSQEQVGPPPQEPLLPDITDDCAAVAVCDPL